MPSYDYDVIVAGAGPGGLSSAALLALKGAKILVLEQADEPGGCCRTVDADGYRFDIGPSAFTGFSPGQPLHRLFNALHQEIRLTEGDFLRPLEPGPQILFSDSRITLYHEFGRLMEELEREYPQCTGLLARLYPLLVAGKEKSGDASIHGVSPAATLRLRWLTQRLKSHQRFMEYMRAFSHFLFPCDGKPNSSILLYLMYHLFSPFYLFSKGSSSLPQFLVDIIRKNDGEVNCGVNVNGLIKDGGKVSGVTATLESVQEQITAGAVIINSFAGMGDDGPTREWKPTGAADKGNPQVLPFSLLLGVEEAALPEPLGPLALAQLNEAIPQAAGGVVRVSLSPPWAEDWAPENERTLKATLFLKKEEERDLDSRSLAGLTQLTLESLTTVIPFLRSHITFMRVFTPDDYMRLCGLEHGALAAGRLRSGLQGRRQTTISPAQGLYLVGAGSQGEFGTLAAVRSGLRTAEALSG